MKKEKYEILKTPHSEALGAVPHDYYPRPQFKRDSFLSLNGDWQFGFGDKADGVIKVPFPPESALSGVEKLGTNAEMFYEKSFTLPEKFNTGRLILHFGAVDTIATVTLNGTLLGAHEGGYHPFSFDITDFVKEENLLSVKVKDDLSGAFPYGKQKEKRGGMWYTPHSGIWQSVWLESVPCSGIEALRITPSVKDVRINVKAGGVSRKITLRDTGEEFVFSGDEIIISPKTVKNWTPEEPYLYYFTLETEFDKIESYFALREIGIKDFDGIKRLTLNGEPYLFNGLLDQGYFPDGIITPATPDAFRDDILLAKECGFNMIRKHIKIEPLIFYHLCDVLGMAVFQDFVNNSDYSFMRDTAMPTVGFKSRSDKKLHENALTREIFEREAKATAELLHNSPSVLYYTVFNEGWGQFCADEMYKKIKELAPDRIIDATSGWFLQNDSDVDSRHIYFKPVKIDGYTGERPLVISEFGGFSHRVEGHLFGSDNYGYKKFKTREEFEAALIKLYEDLIPLIGKGISALVLTQISDVEDETNGLITYDRKALKVDPKKLSEVMKKLYAQL